MTNTIIKIKLIHFLKNTFTKTPAQAVNIARAGSTALTKLKYLFSVSLLTLSLNVVSDTQQFNKAAYLDFSKPYTYNWNNTQAVNKKDNQATTLLKEVAGTVRNALGGIDSNNANQFGKTLSTNVANQLKNKAISTTEGFINDKANEYANSIGSGRSEISIYGIDSQALVTAVNATVTAAAASSSVLADIGTDANTASTSDTTIAEFGAILPALTGFVDANLAAYQAYINDNPGSFSSPATQAEVQAMITAVNPFVAETVMFKGSTYKTVKSPDTNRIWLDRNLGATQVCASSTDSACYGNLYQWGRNDDGHESRTSGITATLATTITPAINKFITSSSDWSTADSTGSSRTSAWADGGANDICPAGFSVPTEAELTADTAGATTTDVINSATAFSSFLKIPVAGYRYRANGALNDVGSDVYLWSRSARGSNGRSLDIGSDTAGFGSTNRAYGLSVRCIRD